MVVTYVLCSLASWKYVLEFQVHSYLAFVLLLVGKIVSWHSFELHIILVAVLSSFNFFIINRIDSASLGITCVLCILTFWKFAFGVAISFFILKYELIFFLLNSDLGCDERTKFYLLVNALGFYNPSRGMVTWGPASVKDCYS